MDPDEVTEHAVSLAAAAGELPTQGLEPLVDAIDRGWQAAREAADPVARPAQFEAAAFSELVTELQEVVPQLVERAMHRWMGHAHHELRQPLAVIEGVAETLQEHYARLDEQTLATLVARLRRQSRLLRRIIDQLGQAAQLRSGRLRVAPHQIDLRPLVEHLRDDFEPLLDGVTVTYDRPDDPVLACVEPAAATEMLVALLRNAVEHAPCDEPILVETIQYPTIARISVHDDGTGIALADRERVFDYGTHLDDAGTLGLGLFIARGLARSHDGDLSIEDSEHLDGARVDLILPTECEVREDT